MASETVDPIDLLLSTTFYRALPEFISRVHLSAVPQMGVHCTVDGMPTIALDADAATQGILTIFFKSLTIFYKGHRDLYFIREI